MQKLEKQKIAIQSSEKKTTQKQLFYFENVQFCIFGSVAVRFILMYGIIGKGHILTVDIRQRKPGP